MQACWYRLSYLNKPVVTDWSNERLTSMAQKTVVTVVCDLPHDDEVEGSESVSFAFDGNAYEIDLCATAQQGTAREGRRVCRPCAPRDRRCRLAQEPVPARAGSAAPEIKELGAPARTQGSERGRIPATSSPSTSRRLTGQYRLTGH